MRDKLSALLLSPFGCSLIDRIERMVPPIRAWHRFAYEHHFSRLSKSDRLYRGVYDSFDEALRAVPNTHSVGYNHPVAGNLYLELIGHIWPADYPVLFWLRSVLEDNSRLFDLGGNIGLHYYSFQKYLTYPTNTEWLICDLPEITKAGQELARHRNSSGLQFTNDFGAAEGTHILLASGTLQYIQTPFTLALSRLIRKPQHLIINKLPLSSHNTYVTLQNMGPIVCPYYIFNRTEFIDSICALGYQHIDIWKNPEFDCFIPFHPEKSIDSFTGLYFRLEA
jgi:putative methyltransferase (TIGR04325 family)